MVKMVNFISCIFHYNTEKTKKGEITSWLYLLAYKYIKGFSSMVLMKRTSMCLLCCLLFEEKDLVSFQNLNSKTMISNTQNSNSLDIVREQLPPLPPHYMAQNVLNHGRSLNSSFMNPNHYSLELKVFVEIRYWVF